MISRKEVVKLIDEVSLSMSKGQELQVVKLTKIFDYVLQDKEVMLSVIEVQRRYKVGRTKVYEWFQSGLKKIECGGTKIRISDLEQFIEDGKA
ncbi:MAG: helix-turn-helix domain-containing protein [Cyclobacteriaceae bacterium]